MAGLEWDENFNSAVGSVSEGDFAHCPKLGSPGWLVYKASSDDFTVLTISDGFGCCKDYSLDVELGFDATTIHASTL